MQSLIGDASFTEHVPSTTTVRIIIPTRNNSAQKLEYPVAIGKWQEIQLNLRRAAPQGALRVQLLPQLNAGTVHIASMRLVNLATGTPLTDQLNALKTHGMAFRVPDPHDFVMAVIGPEACLVWEGPPSHMDCPLALEIRLKLVWGEALTPTDPGAYVQVLKELSRAGRFIEALSFYDKHPSMDILEAGDAEVVTCLIQFMAESDRLIEAYELFVKSMQAKMAVRIFPLEIGLQLEQQGYLDKAESLYAAAMVFFNTRIDVRIARSRVLYALNRPEDAAKESEQALKDFPNNTTLLVDLAMQQINQENRQAGLKLLRAAQNLNGHYPLWALRALSGLTRDVVDIHGVMLPVPSDVVSAKVFLSIVRGEYERNELLFAKDTIQPGDKVLELGGGLGFICTYIKTHIINVEVCTVEANPALIPILQKTLALNNTSATVVYGVASDREGMVDFNVSVNFWSSSIMDIDSQYTTHKIPRVDVNKLLQEFGPNKLIIDIEGGEVDLVPKLNLHAIDMVIIELHQRYTGIEGLHTVIKSLLDRKFMIDTEHTRGNVYTFLMDTASR